MRMFYLPECEKRPTLGHGLMDPGRGFMLIFQGSMFMVYWSMLTRNGANVIDYRFY